MLKKLRPYVHQRFINTYIYINALVQCLYNCIRSVFAALDAQSVRDWSQNQYGARQPSIERDNWQRNWRAFIPIDVRDRSFESLTRPRATHTEHSILPIAALLHARHTRLSTQMCNIEPTVPRSMAFHALYCSHSTEEKTGKTAMNNACRENPLYGKLLRDYA